MIAFACEDVPVLFTSATLTEINAAEYSLTPARVVGTAESQADGEGIEFEIHCLTNELLIAQDATGMAAAVVRQQMEGIRV